MSEKTPKQFNRLDLIDDEATLFVNNVVYGGWTSFSITRSIEAAASTFNLSLIDKWTQDGTPWRIRPGDACHIHVGKKSVVTGYIDSVDVQLDSDSRTLVVSGRSKTADLVDCSIIGSNEYTNLTVAQIAKKIVEPFATSIVDIAGDTTKIAKFNVKLGESVFEALDRLAKQNKLLLYPSVEGNLIIARKGTTRAQVEIRQGVNLLSGNAVYDNSDRFSQYVVKGQTDGDLGEIVQATEPEGTAVDSGVSRYRPLLILAENSVDTNAAKQRAAYEAGLHAARSSNFSISVQGFYQKETIIWDINQLVFLDSPFLGVKQQLLIKSVTYTKSASGTISKLELIRSDAYDFSQDVKKEEDPFAFLGITS